MPNICQEIYHCPGLCCTNTDIIVSPEEKQRLFPKMLPIAIFASGDILIHVNPCPHLEDKQCKVYSERPEACEGYPAGGPDCRIFQLGEGLGQTLNNFLSGH